jgi:hypothetical protein
MKKTTNYLCGLLLGITGCSITTQEAKVIPNRIDYVGYVRTIEYNTNNYGMEREYRANLQTGDFQFNIHGYGHYGFDELKKAMKAKALVAVQCVGGPVLPCEVSALEAILERPKLITKAPIEPSGIGDDVGRRIPPTER